MSQTLTFTRADGAVASFPLIWEPAHAHVDGEWTTVPAPALSDEHDEALTDFAGHDVMQTVVYLWIDGGGVTSADVENGFYEFDDIATDDERSNGPRR